jgi:hypothetical protein
VPKNRQNATGKILPNKHRAKPAKHGNASLNAVTAINVGLKSIVMMSKQKSNPILR